jgi:hypothetical protein
LTPAAQEQHLLINRQVSHHLVQLAVLFLELTQLASSPTASGRHTIERWRSTTPSVCRSGHRINNIQHPTIVDLDRQLIHQHQVVDGA